MESILTSIKKMLGIPEEYTNFDPDVIIHINSVFMILTQLGVGPPTGYSIKDLYNVWNEFLPEEDPMFESVKTFMYIKVKLVFDPPLSSAVLESMKVMANELEWRIHLAAESK